LITTIGTVYRKSRALLLCIILGSVACSTLPAGGHAEPKVIAVRNRSGADIVTVTLRQSGGSPSQATRFGSVSPVPAGVTQSVRRQTDPPRLSPTVTLEWVDNQKRTHTRELSLANELSFATGAEGEMLVFEIRPSGDVLVFVEESSR
jgi:hypothetical protein